MATDSSANGLPAIVRDATCTFCGCLCDDIALATDANRITEVRHACESGQTWFSGSGTDDRPDCSMEGQPASIADGVERAARILLEARYPLIYGLENTTVETQRVAAGIADLVGGVLDSTTSHRRGPTGTSFHGVAEVTCTLGEIAARCDVLLFWGCDPVRTHPRHFDRYSLNARGEFVPGGRHDRTAILVDACRTASADAMDQFHQIKPGADFEALWTLRGLVQGLSPDSERVLAGTGVELARWQELADCLKSARYGAILFGEGLSQTRGRHVNCDAVQALVKDLNAHTRFVASPLRGGGNPVGADQVITWRTGFPFGVNLARGYPRFSPGEYTAEEILSRGEADAALIVASDPLADLSPAACKHLKSIPLIACDFRPTATMHHATVAFTTATFGIHTPGTIYRMDGVPIPLRPALTSSRPSDHEVLVQLERCLRDRQCQWA